MSGVLQEVRNHPTVIDYEREGVIVWLTLRSDEASHHVVRKIESADGFMVSSPMESDVSGAVRLKVISTKYR